MAAGVRRVRVRPDHEVLIGDEIVGVCSREAIVQAIMDGESMLHFSGGILTVAVTRKRTTVVGEAVTTGAIVEWKDGVRAKFTPEVEVEIEDLVEVTAPEEPAEAAEPVEA